MPDIPHPSDAELQDTATVDDDAVDDAARYWREHAGEKWAGLVDAEEIKQTEREG